MHMSKFIEKNTPAPNIYKNQAAWNATRGKLKGCFTNKDDRVTWVQSSGWIAD